MLHNDVATKWGSTRSAMASFRDEKVKKKEQEGENVEEEEADTENNGIEVSIVLPVVKTTMKLIQPHDEDPYYVDALKEELLSNLRGEFQQT